jgi:hypothetical protein
MYKGFLKTNTAITWQLIQTVRTLEAKWWQVLQGSMVMEAKEDESNTGCVWAAVFHCVMPCCCLAGVLKLMNCLFLSFSNFLGAVVNHV